MRRRCVAIAAVVALFVATPAAADPIVTDLPAPAQDPATLGRPTSPSAPPAVSSGSSSSAGGATSISTAAAATMGASLPATLTPDLSKPLQLLSGSVVETDGGSDLRLPPGRFLTEPVWSKFDAEIRRLQNAETNLTAQNKSLQAALGGWQPGWWTLLTMACGAGAAGWWLHGKL